MSTELVPFQKYAIADMAAGGHNIMEIIEENLGGQPIQAADLDRIKVPTGGMTAWKIPTIEGDKMVESITGVVILWRDVRRLWRIGFDERKEITPPDCTSEDCVTGFGNPNGSEAGPRRIACQSCPFSQFKSEIKHGQPGRGQACKQFKQLFILTQKRFLPIVVAIPPSSLAVIRQLFLRMANEHRLYYSVILQLSLISARNANNIEYALIKPQVIDKLDDAQVAKIEQYRAALLPRLNQWRDSETETMADEDLADIHAEAAEGEPVAAGVGNGGRKRGKS